MVSGEKLGPVPVRVFRPRRAFLKGIREIDRKRFAAVAALLFAAGAAAGLLLTLARPRTFAGRVSDALFGAGSAFLIWGLICTANNARVFTGAHWGLKQLRRLFRNEKMNGAKEQDDYLAFRTSRRRHPEAPLLLVCAGALIALSVAAALI